MCISKKRLEAMEKRIADLEKKSQSQLVVDAKKLESGLKDSFSHLQVRQDQRLLARQLQPEQNDQ